MPIQVLGNYRHQLGACPVQPHTLASDKTVEFSGDVVVRSRAPGRPNSQPGTKMSAVRCVYNFLHVPDCSLELGRWAGHCLSGGNVWCMQGGSEAIEVFSTVASRLAVRSNASRSRALATIYGRPSIYDSGMGQCWSYCDEVVPAIVCV